MIKTSEKKNENCAPDYRIYRGYLSKSWLLTIKPEFLTLVQV
jgi:hypothetical protein